MKVVSDGCDNSKGGQVAIVVVDGYVVDMS